MVSMLVLLPWDLNKLCLKVVYPILHLLKVLLHPFALALIVAINLISDYLSVAIYYHIHGFFYFGKIQPYYQGFLFYFVICRKAIESDHAFDLVPF